jgi:hypothetical protein
MSQPPQGPPQGWDPNQPAWGPPPQPTWNGQPVRQGRQSNPTRVLLLLVLGFIMAVVAYYFAAYVIPVMPGGS